MCSGKRTVFSIVIYILKFWQIKSGSLALDLFLDLLLMDDLLNLTEFHELLAAFIGDFGILMNCFKVNHFVHVIA